METCAFCGLDPYHREDVGFGGRGVAVAVTCCEAGILAYGRGSEDETIEMTAAELREISAKIGALEWEVKRREHLIGRLWRRRCQRPNPQPSPDAG